MSPPFPKLKLTYLNIKGRAESSRLALHIAGIPFEDERIGYATLVDMKQSYPFGQVPVLLVNDTIQIAQTHAILRYVGVLGGLYPDTDVQKAALVDQINFHISDIMTYAVASLHEQDADQKPKLCKIFVEEKAPAMLRSLDHVIEQHSGGKWAVGDSLTIADLSIYYAVEFLTSGPLSDLLTNISHTYARIFQVHHAVSTHPKVVQWEAAHSN
ncbi:hypothetical protein BASA61_004406 [Batrachochytrium salamandrivorans]|nr:hypothetical protein BASA61_004406 [Batrachochytrium salamandrivorans]KAH9275403.1 hypothetical protein BASA83_002176 [Batrachochytrium salamandrivorans]